MSVNKATVFVTLIAGLFFGLTTIYNGCAPVASTSMKSFGSGGPGGGGSGGSDDSSLAKAGESYFKTVLTGIFKDTNQGCVGCHGSPRELTVPITDAGPILYESYSKMRGLLLTGSSATNNDFYNRATNVNGDHPGGNRCAIFGASDTPCKEFMEWYQLETNSNSAVPGQITAVTALGNVDGWAADAKDTDRAVTVNLYEGGPSGTGTPLGSVSANQLGGAGGFAGNHRFRLQLPENLRDGTIRDVYAYGLDTQGNEVELAGSPFSAASYVPSQASIDEYNANVAGALNSCQSCHVYNFDEAFNRLLAPTPANGGTATNNRLYVYATGGNGHGGGNACGGNCQALINWYNITFP